MHGVVTQRSSSGLSTAAAFACSSHGVIHTPFRTCKSHTNYLGFHKRQVPSRQNVGSARFFVVKADATTSGDWKYVAPLRPESRAGQFLLELLHSHPHLLSAAAEQQLEKLAEDRKAAVGEEPSSNGGGDLVLYKRIAELKAQERQTAVEEVIYALICQQFLEAQISMVPMIPSLSGQHKVDNWPTLEKELRSVHSSEALDMVWEHLDFILGVEAASEPMDDNVLVQISKLHMGQVYATSALYGYFLKRVDDKFQMEKSMKVPSPNLGDFEQHVQNSTNVKSGHQYEASTGEMLASIAAMLRIGSLNQDASFARKTQPTNLLRDYILSFEPDTLYWCASVRSMESASVIERHTQALFGKPDLLDDSGLVREEIILLSLAGLKRLVLEAVAFGRFLWSVESIVDNHYTIVTTKVH